MTRGADQHVCWYSRKDLGELHAEMLSIIVDLVLYLSVPAAAMVLCKRSRILEALSPVVLCYAVGILMANQPWLEVHPELAQNVSAGAILLAIVLLLLPVDFRAWLRLARVTTLSCLLCMAVVGCTSIVGALIFAPHVPEAWKVSFGSRRRISPVAGSTDARSPSWRARAASTDSKSGSPMLKAFR